tara:strand:- start:537 stop:764 length:228 start_codon:yes stop_codon:yes gene_type:complete
MDSRIAHMIPAFISSFSNLIFLYLKNINNKVHEAAIKNLIAEKIEGGIDFNDSSTNSKVIPHMKVVNTSPDIAIE